MGFIQACSIYHYLVQNQHTHSGMNQHFETIHHMTFPNMFSDYALGTYPPE